MVKPLFKTPKVRSKKLTRAAENSGCTAHTPDCNGDLSTVVFCHAPSEFKGMATKGDDFWGADCCSACHYWLDVKASPDEGRDYWMRAIYRTLKRRFADKILTVN